MPRRTWDILLHKHPHRIELAHGFLSARRRILLDGNDVPIPEAEQCPFPDFGSVHAFEVDGVPCAVVITSNGFTFGYDLVVDGLSHATNKPPVLPVRPAHLPASHRFVYENPGVAAVLFAIIGLVATGFGVKVGLDLAGRPDVAPRVALTASHHLVHHEWITLDGLSVDCAVPPIRLDDSRYRPAGRDEARVPVFVSSPNDECRPGEATGTIGTIRGTHGEQLRVLAGASEVRVLDRVGGPENDRIGVIVCVTFALLGFSIVALLGPKALRLSRLAERR